MVLGLSGTLVLVHVLSTVDNQSSYLTVTGSEGGRTFGKLTNEVNMLVQVFNV